MKVSEKVSNQTTMGKRLERFGEVRIVDETNGFGLNFVEEEDRNKVFNTGLIAQFRTYSHMIFHKFISTHATLFMVRNLIRFTFHIETDGIYSLWCIIIRHGGLDPEEPWSSSQVYSSFSCPKEISQFQSIYPFIYY